MFKLFVIVWLYGYTTIVIQHTQVVSNKVWKVQVAQLANKSPKKSTTHMSLITIF